VNQLLGFHEGLLEECAEKYKLLNNPIHHKKF
jgi:hypothetical protein